METEQNKDTDFSIKSTEEFRERENQVFGRLPNISLRSGELPMQKSSYIIDEDLIGHGKIPKKKFFEERDFKIPSSVPTKKKRFVKRDPQKWKLYSLENVDISEKSNKFAAYSFLDEVNKRKRKTATEESEVKFEKIVFKKPKRLPDEVEESKGEISMQEATRKHVKAAFEFRQIKCKGSTENKSILTTKELLLDHLITKEEE